MRRLLIFASFVGLLLTIVPSFLVFNGTLSWNAHASLVLLGTVIWFATAGWWMREG